MLKRMGRIVAKVFLDFLFPTFCWHCQGFLDDEAKVLCLRCWSCLKFLECQNRCFKCFCEMEEEGEICYSCIRNNFLLTRLAGAFPYGGPAKALVKGFKYGDRPDLAQGLGNFMAIQYLNLEWKRPDFICPVPLSVAHQITRGYNQAALLAKALSETLSIPFVDLLRRSTGDFSQAGQSAAQRKKLTAERFHVRRNAPDYYRKRILLIDDVATTGSTLNCCAQTLLEESSCEVWALVFCSAQPYS